MLRMAMALLLVLLAGAATPLTAQVRYKDAEGVTQWVNSIDEVPEQFRPRAVGKPVKPAPPGASPSIDWDQKARDIERERAEKSRQMDQEAERARAAEQLRRDQQRAADEQSRRRAELGSAAIEEQKAWAKAVAACRQEVRSGSGAPTQYSTGFDAFVSGVGRVQMLGAIEVRLHEVHAGSWVFDRVICPTDCMGRCCHIYRSHRSNLT